MITPDRSSAPNAGGVPRTRRALLRTAGVATTVGVASCSGLLDENAATDGTDRDCTAAEAADSVSEYATHPDDDVAMFQRGLRRLGYYPDETVPESPASSGSSRSTSTATPPRSRVRSRRRTARRS